MKKELILSLYLNVIPKISHYMYTNILSIERDCTTQNTSGPSYVIQIRVQSVPSLSLVTLLLTVHRQEG